MRCLRVSISSEKLNPDHILNTGAALDRRLDMKDHVRQALRERGVGALMNGSGNRCPARVKF